MSAQKADSSSGFVRGFDYQVEIVDGPPWGFRISGGREYNQGIKVSFIKPGTIINTASWALVDPSTVTPDMKMFPIALCVFLSFNNVGMSVTVSAVT